MIESRELEKMSIAERLRTIEQIWDSLYRNADEVPSPDWHGEVLAERKRQVQDGESSFLTLEQLRLRIRDPRS